MLFLRCLSPIQVPESVEDRAYAYQRENESNRIFHFLHRTFRPVLLSEIPMVEAVGIRCSFPKSRAFLAVAVQKIMPELRDCSASGC